MDQEVVELVPTRVLIATKTRRERKDMRTMKAEMLKAVSTKITIMRTLAIEAEATIVVPVVIEVAIVVVVAITLTTVTMIAMRIERRMKKVMALKLCASEEKA